VPEIKFMHIPSASRGLRRRLGATTVCNDKGHLSSFQLQEGLGNFATHNAMPEYVETNDEADKLWLGRSGGYLRGRTSLNSPRATQTCQNY